MRRNALREQFRVEVGVLNLDNVDVYFFAAYKLFEILFELVDAPPCKRSARISTTGSALRKLRSAFSA